jgi:FixJ family two-component response regulator/signal transduction histidine kinase
MTLSITAVTPGTNSSTSHDGSCRLDCVNGPTSSDQQDLVLGVKIGSRFQHMENNLLTLIWIKRSTAIMCYDAWVRQNGNQLSVGPQSKRGSFTTPNVELWSRNEDLTGINIQLQKKLERQRVITRHLQNLLYGADVATLFLDGDLILRFFTPAAKVLFDIISSDLGRPLSDLESLAADGALLADARAVLRKQISIVRVIETQSGLWFIRQVLLCRTNDNRLGVVITSINITAQNQATKASELAMRRAELARAAKSRFLAAASHDLCQPLQTLYLLQGLLATVVEGEKASNLVKRIDQTLSRMSGMLTALRASDQMEASVVRTDMIDTPVNDLPNQLKDEAALEMLAAGTIQGDLILADYSLPIDINAPDFAAPVKDNLLRGKIPVRIVTGDTSVGTLLEIVGRDREFGKPVKSEDLMQATPELSPPAPNTAAALSNFATPNLFLVDDDRDARGAIRAVLEHDGWTVEVYSMAEEFLDAWQPGCGGCLLVDACLPGMDGFELLHRLHSLGHRLPSIMITGRADVPMAVRAMKAGVLDFIEKPISRSKLLASVRSAMEKWPDPSELLALQRTASNAIASLTLRQRQVLDMVLAGKASKNIARYLGISQRTVENHRASIMRKTGSKSLPALGRLALAATWKAAGDRGSVAQSNVANQHDGPIGYPLNLREIATPGQL